jgi:GTPase Era involved in 16S rRNA processing
MDEAERLYNSVYFKTGLCHINKAYSKGEIAKFLRQRDSTTKLKAFAQKVEKAGTIIKIVKDVQDKVGLALKAFDCYSRGKDLNQQQKDLKTAQDYKEYYYKIAKEASAMASELKKFSDKLPPGMRDYYEFIFTVAENTDKMAKVVYDYVEKLEKAMTECDRELKKMGEKKFVH